MNFFVFDSGSKAIRISNDFWIFVATWLPLTLITGTLYMLIVYLDKRKKGKKFIWPWTRLKIAAHSEKQMKIPSSSDRTKELLTRKEEK
jgi:hypothetical protein